MLLEVGALFWSTIVPVMFVAPVYVLFAVKVAVVLLSLFTIPVPLIALAKVILSERLILKVPLFTILPEPILPVVPLFPN